MSALLNDQPAAVAAERAGIPLQLFLTTTVSAAEPDAAVVPSCVAQLLLPLQLHQPISLVDGRWLRYTDVGPEFVNWLAVVRRLAAHDGDREWNAAALFRLVDENQVRVDAHAARVLALRSLVLRLYTAIARPIANAVTTARHFPYASVAVMRELCTLDAVAASPGLQAELAAALCTAVHALVRGQLPPDGTTMSQTLTDIRMCTTASSSSAARGHWSTAVCADFLRPLLTHVLPACLHTSGCLAGNSVIYHGLLDAVLAMTAAPWTPRAGVPRWPQTVLDAILRVFFAYHAHAHGLAAPPCSPVPQVIRDNPVLVQALAFLYVQRTLCYDDYSEAAERVGAERACCAREPLLATVREEATRCTLDFMARLESDGSGVLASEYRDLRSVKPPTAHRPVFSIMRAVLQLLRTGEEHADLVGAIRALPPNPSRKRAAPCNDDDDSAPAHRSDDRGLMERTQMNSRLARFVLLAVVQLYDELPRCFVRAVLGTFRCALCEGVGVVSHEHTPIAERFNSPTNLLTTVQACNQRATLMPLPGVYPAQTSAALATECLRSLLQLELASFLSRRTAAQQYEALLPHVLAVNWPSLLTYDVPVAIATDTAQPGWTFAHSPTLGVDDAAVLNAPQMRDAWRMQREDA